jgi:hypothetical protein
LCARDNGCALQTAEVGFVALNNGAANVMGEASGQTNPGEAEGSIVRASHLRAVTKSRFFGGIVETLSLPMGALCMKKSSCRWMVQS